MAVAPNEQQLHWYIAVGMILCAFITLIHEIRGNAAPYGRYSPAYSGNKGNNKLGLLKNPWGPLWNAKLCWVLMEVPNLLMALFCWCFGEESIKYSPVNMIILSLFIFHYINRSLVFPLRMRGGKPMPVGIMAMAFLFCCINGYLQCRFLCSFKKYPDQWLQDPRFILGVVIFFTGFSANYHADHVLRTLRKPGETGYKIPHGGLFEFVSGANFAGETLEWTGFALAAWSYTALAFAIFTFCNIGPRAVQHHSWYLEKFKEEYPANRKAFIPFVF